MERDNRDIRWKKRRDDFFLRGETVQSPFTVSQSSPVEPRSLKPEESNGFVFNHNPSVTTPQQKLITRRRPDVPLLPFSLLSAPFPPISQQQLGGGTLLLPKLFEGRKVAQTINNTRPW